MKKAASTQRATVVFWLALAGAAWLLAVWLVSNGATARNGTVSALSDGPINE